MGQVRSKANEQTTGWIQIITARLAWAPQALLLKQSLREKRIVRRAHPPAILNRFASNEGLTTSDKKRREEPRSPVTRDKYNATRAFAFLRGKRGAARNLSGKMGAKSFLKIIPKN